MGVDPLTIAAGAAVVGALTGTVSAYTQYEAGQEAKAAAGRAAKAEAASTAEQVKRLQEENERKSALARARAAASGVGGASTEIYIDALEKAGREEIDWLKEVGASTYLARLDEGTSAYLSAQAGMWGSIGQTASYGGQAWSAYSSKSE